MSSRGRNGPAGTGRLATARTAAATDEALTEAPSTLPPTGIEPSAPPVGSAGLGRFFYGWYVVGAVMMALAFSSGLGFYNLGVYLRAVTEERGLSVGAVSGATALFFAVAGLGGVGAARLIARFDVRRVMAAGALLAGGALVALGQVRSLWQLYAVYAVFALGWAACGLVPATTLVTRWFHRRRAVALSVASTGLSVGGAAITPLSARLIDDWGLPEAMPWLALAWVVGIVPVTLAVLRPSPESMGLSPDGDPVPAGPAAPVGGWPYAQAVRSRFFVCVSLAYVVVMGSQVGSIAHLFNLVSEQVDEGTARRAVTVLAVSSIVGRLSGGWVVTRFSMSAMTVGCAALQGVALFLLGQLDGRWPLLVTSALFGITVGNLLMLQPLLLAERFGVRDYPRVYSRSQLVTTVGLVLGPVVLGVLHDAAGNYRLAMAVAAVACAAGVALLVAAGPATATPPPDPA